MNDTQLNNLKNNILDKTDYKIVSNDSDNKFSINDIIVCFSNGLKWHIVSLDTMITYPVLYFDFTSPKDGQIYTNSLLVCPITLRSMIYKGRIKILKVVNDRLFIRNIDTDDDFFMDLPYTGHRDEKGNKKNIKSQVKRHQVKIMTLKDSLTIVTDPTFIILSDKTFKESIFSKNYYTNSANFKNESVYCRYHPKTLVYVTQHYSHTIETYKYNIITGVDISQEDQTGYNFKKAGFWHFFNDYTEDLNKKKAYIYPMFFYYASKLYPNAKLIHLI